MIKQGDGVFYTDNQTPPETYCPIAVKVISDLGLTPYFYMGTGMDVRRSNLDRGIRDDFYRSKIVVLVLGKGKEWRSIEDNWAIPELKHATSFGINCLIYGAAEITAEEVASLELPFDPTKIRDEQQFRSVLEHDLRALMISP